MSEKAPAVNTEMIDDIIKVDKNGKARRDDGKFLSNKQIALIEEHQDVIRDNMDEYSDAPKERAEKDGSATTAEVVVDSATGELRPVKDGEYGDDYLKLPENSDPDHEDYLPVGVMAHEPWTFADAPETTKLTTPTNNGGNEPTPSDGRYDIDGEDLFNGGREDMNPEGGEPNNGGYDGPVESGSEIEPYVPGGEIEPVPTPGELVQQIEVDPALSERLDLARSRYAEATAKSRKSYLGRFMKNDTQVTGLLARVPGVKSLVKGWNRLKDTKGAKNLSEGLDSMLEIDTLAAKAEYEAAYTALSEATAAELARVGWEEDVVRQLSLIGNISQDALLEDHILYQRQAQGKATSRFANWWVNQSGLKGNLKKAGVVIAAGAVTGLTGGLFAGATAAFIAGGAAGASIGVHVTRRRANTLDAEGRTLALRQSLEDRATKEADIQASHAIDGVGSVEDVTGGTETRTDEEMLGNRKRIKTATLLGAAAGKGAFKIGEMFKNQPDAPKPPTEPKPPETPETPDVPRPKPPETPDVPKPPTPEVPRPQFNVEPGSGFEREISQYFANNGQPISGSEAHKLYESLVNQYGSNGLIKPSETYLRSGTDYGISQPGMYEVADGPAKILSDWLAAKQ